VAEVKSLPAGRHADGDGIYLLVKDTGARSWVFRFMLNGKARDIGLGPASGNGAIKLADVREAAKALRTKVKAGIDPLTERQDKAAQERAKDQASKVAQISFKAVAEAYIAKNAPSWRNAKHRQQWVNTLEAYVYPVIGDLPVAEVDTPHVLHIIEPIWADKPETASRIRGRIEMILNFAKARKYRQGDNPARWSDNIKQILPARTRLSRGHHTALHYDALPGFISELKTRQATAALALEFTILTACRSGEVLGATWDEIDFQKAVWIIPANRMKAAVEHHVPLTGRAIEILETVEPLTTADQYAHGSVNRVNSDKLTGPVFRGDRGGKLSGMAMSMLLRRMKSPVTVHGFRSTFRDWAAERTGYAHEVCEMALAHTIGNKAEAAYRRGNLFDKRRRLMDDWAAFCSGAHEPKAKVTPIRAVVA
jgi:integrase